MSISQIIALVYFICTTILSFDFKQLTVAPTLYNVGVTTQYYLYLERSVSSSNGQSPWNLQQVPADSLITITFPSDYTITSPTCISVLVSGVTATGANCTTSGNTITISGAIPNAAFIDTVEVTLGNIVNPVPAVVTGSFQGTIGLDNSFPGGNVQLTASTFDNCAVTFDTAFVNQTSATMVITLDPKNALDSFSSILVDLPARWTNDIVAASRLPVTTTMICVNYSSSAVSSPTCAGNNVQYSVTVTNVLAAPTTGSFAFGIRQMSSPPTLQPSDAITITSYSGIYEVDSCTVFVSGLIPNTFTNVVMNSIQTMTVNTDVGFTLQLTLPDWANNNDDVQITFPTQIVPTFVNATGSSIYNSTTSTVSGQVMTLVQQRTSQRTYNRGSVYSINVYRIRAPPSTKTTNQITVKIMRNGFDKMIGYTTMRAVASNLTGVAAATLTTVNRITTYRINITTTDPLTSGGMIRITFPSTITPTLTSACATLSGTSVRTNPTCAYDSSSNTITLTNLNSSTSTIPAQTFRFTILSVQNGPSIGTSGPFLAYTYYTNDINDMVSQGTILGVNASMDILDASRVSVVPSSYIVSDTLVTYTVNFVTGNNIPQSGFVELTIPPAVTLSLTTLSTYCKLAINNGSFFSTPCSGSNTGSGYYVNFSNIAQSSARAAGTTISLRIQTLLTNPGDTSIVSSFTIKTYHSDGFAIQQLTTGITVQMTIPSTITPMNITRSSQLNSNPATTYTFRLKQTPALPANCRLTVGFPSNLIITGTIGCTSLGGAPLGFTQSASSIQVQLTSAVGSEAEFGVVISGVGNPPSFAPFSAPFTFSTRSSDRILSYATGSVSSTLTTSIPSNFATLSGTYSSLIYGQPTNLLISVTPSSRMTPSYLLVTIPSGFTIPSTLSCTTWSCTSISSHVIKINNITSTSQISFTITGMTAPLAATTDSVLVNSFDSGTFKIDQNSATGSILFNAACTLPCRTCSTNTSACLTCYSNTAISTSVYYYSAQSTCYINCPPGTYSDSSSGLRCLDCNSLCRTCVVTSTNCTSCVSNSTYPYLFVNSSTGTCRTLCPTYFYADTSASPVQCIACTGRCYDCTSATQCTSCVYPFLYYNGTCDTSCPTGITIANNVTNNCDPCNTICATCSGTVDTCIGCSGTAAVQNGTCVAVCSAPLVKRNGVCSSCSTNCLTCSINFDNCTSCVSNSTLPFLYGTTCVGVCPELYYSSVADGACKLCSLLNIGCNNCTSTSTCGTCNWDQGFVFLSSRCYSSTPTGYYNNSGYAVACDATRDCATCLNFAYNCTACATLNLEGNTCVAQCAAGFVGINKLCVACASTCRTCSNLQTNCTSCKPNQSPQVYLSNFQCITTCPDYTYANVTNNQCTNCFSPCQRCTSFSLCSTCQLGFFLENTSCVANCSYGYLGVNRICQRCTSNCDACSQSLSLCTACLPGFYLVTSTSTCVNPCPTGLYPNAATGTCTGCVTPCNTCSITATDCTSCLNGLALFNNTCVSNCTDGYYLLNSQCNLCNGNCSTCSSSTVCLTCVFGLYLYSGNCVGQCPSTHPVTTTGTCTACTDANCLVCDNLDQCSQCNFPTLVLSGHCMGSCPTNYTSNTTHCNYNPPNDTNTNDTNTTNNTSNQTLNQTLSSTNIFPVPFTIGATFIGVACIMSKFQHSYTFMSGSLYSMWSLLEWGSLGVGAYLYYQTNKAKLAFTSDYIEAFVFAGAVGFMYLLNLLALFAQNCYLRGQIAFKRWLDKQGGNSCFYTFTTAIGLLVTHKFKNILFCKLFGFDIFKARLDSIQSFRIFNILSFLSFVPSGAILFSTSYMIYKHHVSDQELMAYVDILVLTVACIVLAVLNSRKGEDFFQEKDEDGFVINKRIIQSDSIMQEAITPFMAEEHEDRGNMAKNNTYETERKFRSYNTESISDQSSYQYIEPPKDVHDISIQAAPVLQDYSRIDFYNDEQMSDMSMFKKVDRSVNMTKQFHANEVSVQNDLNVFEQRDISIQNQPMQDDISVQHQVDVRDISLQNVANLDDQGVQMSRHEEDHSIQVGVLVNNASIQYSAKPVFQNLSEDFMDSDGQQNVNNNNTQLDQEEFSKEQKPAETPKGLQAQLELDVDQKLRQKQEQMQLQREQEIARKKQQMLRKFHQQQEKKIILSRQKQLENNDNFEKVNKIYNNDNSRLDGSSLMDSDANIMVHFRKNTKKEIRQKEQEIEPRNGKQDRVQSAKTQKQFIDMLQNNQPGLDVQSSMSFNVTRDLEDANSNKNKKVKNVVYEQQDKNMDSGEEDIMMEQQPQRNKSKDVYVLQNDTGEQIPSIEKSRSTNFLSTNGRRPPLPYRTPSKNLLDESSRMENSIPENDDEQIVNHPIKAVAKHVLPHPYYREQEIQYTNKTNLNQFDRRKNNPVSAHQFSTNQKIPYSQSDQLFPSKQKEARQNPLPLPKIERLKSQESNHSNDNNERLYRLNSRKALMEDRKLEFDEEERINNLNSDQDQYQSRLPRVINSQSRLKNVKSLSKFPQRDNSYEKPVHRQILGRDRFVDRTQKFLQKESKKAESTKKKIEQMEVMLERPNINTNKGYLKETHSSTDKKKKSELEKVYMNNPFEKKF